MNERSPDYRAYLLRLWHARDDGDRWRASLEDAGTRELHIFADVNGLVSYLTTIVRPIESPDMEDADSTEDASGLC